MIRRVQLGLLSLAAVSFVTALVLASSAHDVMAAPNLVVNGDFATNDNNWTDQVDTTGTWAPGPANDADGNSNSGSIQVVYDHVDTPGQGVVESDCITLTGDGTYELQGDSRLSSGNSALTNAYLRVQLYTDLGCVTPDIVTGTFDTNQNTANDDNWTEPALFNDTITVAGHLSARVLLIVEADDFTNEIGNFDNVALSNGDLDTPTPTPTDTPTETNTPVPTDTPEPAPTDTPTPVPTDTPIPPPTDMPEPPPTDTPEPPPTDTPVPTDTPDPNATPTDTPVPTDTPAPTDTPPATNTPVPTATETPVATDTPAGTSTPDPNATATQTAVATDTPEATNTTEPTEEPTSTETVEPVATEDLGLPPASEIEQPSNDGGAGGAGGDPSAAGELPETGTGSRAVEDLTMPLALAGMLALMGALALAGVEYHRIRQ